MPGFGVPGGLPGIPSPAQGTPQTPDLLSGLLQAAPQAVQGYEQGMEVKKQRREQALQDLQQLLPYGIQDPKNPATLKAIQKAVKQMGIDPKTIVAPDGTLNAGALMQYNPYFPVFTSLLQNPNASQSSIDTVGKLVGLSPDMVPKVGPSPRDITAAATNFKDLLNKYITQGGDKTALISAASGYSEMVRQHGDNKYADAILAEANGAQPSEKAKAQIGYITSSMNEKQQHAALVKAEVNYISGKTGLLGLQGEEIKSRIQKNIVTTQTAVMNANASMIKANAAATQAQAALARLSIDTAGHAVSAAKDFNDSYRALLASRDSLQKTIQGYVNTIGSPNIQDNLMMPDPHGGTNPDGTPKMVPSTLGQARSQLQQVDQQLQQMNQQAQKSGYSIHGSGMLDTNAVYSSALHGGGFPNTQRAVGNPPTSTKPTGGGGPKTVSNAKLIQWAREAKMSVKDAKAALQAQGYSIGP